MKVLIVNCVILGLCSSHLQNKDDYSGSPPTITLLYSDHEDHKDINNRFFKITEMLGFHVNVITLKVNNVLATIDEADTKLNVINLKIPPTSSSPGALYNIYVELWQSNIVCAVDCNFYNDTRLISTSILQYNRLYEIVQSEELKFLDEILICLPKNMVSLNLEKINSHSKIPLKIKVNCDESTKTDNNTLAVITYTPIADSRVPTIFYQMPYFLPENKDRFPNSINLSASWKHLKYAFKEFLEQMQWSRVAVLSDDSEYSREFTGELIGMFLQAGITFITQECENRKCNFLKELQALKEANARIIILNVESKNAVELVKAINNANMTNMRQVKWIVRDWPVENFAMAMRHVYSINIYPFYKSHRLDLQEVYIDSIKQGLTFIQNTYRSVLGDKESFERKFVKRARRLNSKYVTYAIVKKHFNGYDNSSLSTMIINGDNVNVLSFKKDNTEFPSDLPQSCIVRSSNFIKACAHEELLLLVAVLVMFVLFLLIIVVYFSKYRSRHYSRFR